MGIFGALNTAVTGLRAQSYALENISGNIANSQTTGFKRIDTSFLDLIPDATLNQQLAGSVLAQSRATNSVQGDLLNASISTFMAINGDGFFVVQQPTNFSNNLPVFSGSNLYTRRGDFSLNKDGYLVNGAGYYLMGIPIDPATGNPVGSVPQSLQFNNDALPAQVTTQIQYRVNLPRVPVTPSYDSATPGSELLQLADYATNPLVAGGNGGVTANDASTFLSQSIGGGEITAYDSSGSPVNIQMRWAKTGSATLDSAGAFTATNAFAATTLTDAADTIAFSISVDGGAATPVTINQAAVQAVGNGDTTIDSVAEFNSILANAGVSGVAASLVGGRLTLTSNTTGATSSVAISGYTLTDADADTTDSTGIGLGTSVAGVNGADTWELFYLENASATGTQIEWRNAGQTYSFDANMMMSPAVANLTLSGVTINGTAIGDIQLIHGSTGITQFADTNGTVQYNLLQQNGYPAGELMSIAVNDKGRITGTYSNGQTIDLAEVTLAEFNGTDQLKRLDGGAFAETAESGPPLYGASGTILSSALESANVDIADEFTKLIVTQQAYSANTRVVTTSNQMVQDLLNMLR
jgi:flagellar hook protein FlgE